MSRTLCFLAGLVFIASADGRQANDPIDEALQKAKGAYADTLENSAKTILNAFKAQTDKVTNDKTLNAVMRQARLKQLEQEQDGFKADRTKLPDYEGLKIARAGYESQVEDAKKKCKAAFDVAANAYDRMKNLGAVNRVLAEKARLFPRDFAGWYQRKGTPAVFQFGPNGQVLAGGKEEGTWKGNGDTCEVAWDTGWKLILTQEKNGKNLIGNGYDEKGVHRTKDSIVIPIAPPKK